jgi:hypothetical protein
MIKKTYEYKGGTSALVTVPYEGGVKSFEFKGGKLQPYVRKPYLVLEAEKDQKALEASKQFKMKHIRLVGEESVKGEPSIYSIEPQPSETELTPVEGIEKVQQAKEYMLDNYEDLKAGDLPNKDAILKKAAEKMISFPDLK